LLDTAAGSATINITGIETRWQDELFYGYILRTNKRLSAGSKLLAYDICTMACVEIINPSDQNLYDGMHVTRETQCHMLQAT
jgi:hypothetical protein